MEGRHANTISESPTVTRRQNCMARTCRDFAVCTAAYYMNISISVTMVTSPHEYVFLEHGPVIYYSCTVTPSLPQTVLPELPSDANKQLNIFYPLTLEKCTHLYDDTHKE